MDLAWISLLSLALVVALSCTTNINVGFLAIAMAWVIGVFLAPYYGYDLTAKDVLGGFPSELFVTLAGVTLLFSLAQLNGTLPWVARWAMRGCRGNVFLLAPMFFLVTLGMATIGAGNIAAAALVAPMALSVAARARVPPLLMVLAVGQGAVAGGLSPFSPMGVIANGLMEKIGLGGHAWHIYTYNAAANALVTAIGYLALGGWRLIGRRWEESPNPQAGGELPQSDWPTPIQWLTLAVIAALVTGVVGLGVNIALAAFAALAFLLVVRAGDQREVIRAVPWGVLMMVSGMTMLVSLAETTGGVTLFSDLLKSVSTRHTIIPLVAWVSGFISVFSSTSGVVLPVFIPLSNDLADALSANPLSVATAINIGSGIVDVSPVSTIGALCLAAVAPDQQSRWLFHQVLAWGLGMSLAGALVCWLLLPA